MVAVFDHRISLDNARNVLGSMNDTRTSSTAATASAATC